MKFTLAFLFSCLALFACKSPTSSNVNAVKSKTASAIENLDLENFGAALARQPGIMLDVRTPEEFNAGQIPGAININFYDDDFKKQIEALNKNQTAYVYCKSGGRSSKAATILAESGFNKVINLVGGYNAFLKRTQ